SMTATIQSLDATRKEYTVTWRDPRNCQEVRYVMLECADFPVVEWTVSLKNQGRTDTPILANIRAIDIALQHPIKEGLSLHNIGIFVGFAARLKPLAACAVLEFSLRSEPTSRALPYYNVGWSGQGTPASYLATIIRCPSWAFGVVQAFFHDENNNRI